MASQRSTSSGFPWKGLLIFILLLTLCLVGLKFKETWDKNTKLENKVALLNSEISKQSEQIDNLVALSKKTAEMCTPAPEDAGEQDAPCIKCLSVLKKISPSEAEKTIELGSALEKAYLANPDAIDYSRYHSELLRASEELMAGRNLLFSVNSQRQHEELLKEKDKQIADLQEKLSGVSEALAGHEQVQAELEKCLANSNFYIQHAGLDRAPCWLNDDGSLQYLFDLTLLPNDQVIVNPAWPASRDQEADNMAPLKALKPNFGKPMSLTSFLRRAREIHEIGNSQADGACRFFVRLQSEIPDRETADKARLAVEGVFYKFEKQH